MNKEQVVKFLEEQRDARLIGFDAERLSDFDKWQLEQAETFQEVIDWIGELETTVTKYIFVVQEYSEKRSFIPSREFLLSVKAHNYEDAIQKTMDKLPQDKRDFNLLLSEMVVD